MKKYKIKVEGYCEVEGERTQGRQEVEKEHSLNQTLIDKKTKVDLKIQHSNPEISKAIREVLEEEQEKGNLTFEMKTRRKCDFCDRTLTEKDDFESYGGLDKCKSCIEGDR